jgi:hypothetical protein
MVLAGPACKLVRCEPVEARVWPLSVVVNSPSLDDPAGFAHVREQRLVQALVA